MKNKVLLLLFVVFLGKTVKSNDHIDSSRIFVKSNFKIDFYEILSKNELEDISITETFKLKFPRGENHYTIKLLDKSNIRIVIELLNKLDFIEYWEFAPIYYSFYLPNDPQIIQQWYHNNIKSETAWDLAKGSSNIKIAIIDDAILLNHEDLKNKIWTNVNEIPNNNLDDDNNGYIDDYKGYDVGNSDGNPNPPTNRNLNHFNHGSHVAGIAAGETNNNKGISSIGFNTSIIPIKASKDNSNGVSITNSLEGIEYSIIIGADIVNMSFGGGWPSKTVEDLIDYGYSQNMIFVAAAGNDNSLRVNYPAGYKNVIAVASTDQSNKKSSFSSYGGFVDICAPGSTIFSCIAKDTNLYEFKSGTSMAAPIVSGVCALLKGLNPYLTNNEIINCIKQSALNIYPNNPSYQGLLGSGLIDAENALRCIKPIFANFNSNYSESCPNGLTNFKVDSLSNPDSLFWTFENGNPSTSKNNQVNVQFSSIGIKEIKLVVWKNGFKDSIIKQFLVRIPELSTEVDTIKITGNTLYPLKITYRGQKPYTVKIRRGAQTINHSVANDSVSYVLINLTNETPIIIDSVLTGQCSFKVGKTIIVKLINKGPFQYCGNEPGFAKQIKLPGNQTVNSIFKTLDGGYLISSGTTNLGAGGNDILIVQLDKFFNIKKILTFGGTGNEFENAHKFEQDADSNIYLLANIRLVGNTPDGAYLVKFDKNLNILFQRKYNNGGDDYGRDIIINNQGHLIISGTSGSLPRSGSQDAIITKLDTSGNILWTRKYGNTNNLSTTHFTGATKLPSGNIIVVGAGDHFNTPYIGVGVKINPISNTTIQNINFITSGFDIFTDVVYLRDNSLAFINSKGTAGNALHKINVLKTDTNYNIIWQKEFSGGNVDQVKGILPTADSGLIITGTTNSFSSGNFDLFISKLDKNGNITWAKKFGGAGNEELNFFGHPITIDENGNYIFSFTSNSYSTDKDIIIIKVAPCGDISGCDAQSINFSSSNPSFNINSNYTYTNNTGNTEIIAAATINNYTNLYNDSIETKCTEEFYIPLPCQLNANFNENIRCLDSNSIFIDNSTGSSSFKRNWYINDSLLRGKHDSILEYRFNKKGNNKVKLEIFYSEDIKCKDSLVKNIFINPSIDIILDYKDTVCKGEKIIVQKNVNYCREGKLIYEWINDATSITTYTDSLIVVVDTNTRIRLNVYELNKLIFSDTIFLIVNQNCCVASANYFLDEKDYCQGTFLTIKDLSFPMFNNNRRIDVINENNLLIYDRIINAYDSIKLDSSGNYKIVLKIQNSCGADSVEKFIYVNRGLGNNNKLDTTICNSNTFNLIHPNTGEINSKWFLNNILIGENLDSANLQLNEGMNNVVIEKTSIWTGCGLADTIKIKNVSLESLPDTLISCDQNSLFVDSLPINSTITWDDLQSSINPRPVNAEKYYRYQIKNEICSFIDSLYFNYPLNDFSVEIDEEICPDQDSIEFKITGYFDSVKINGINYLTGKIIPIQNTFNNYKIFYKNCFYEDSFFVEKLNTIDIFGDSLACDNNNGIYLKTNYLNNNKSIIWNNSIIADSINITRNQKVIVKVLNTECLIQDSILINFKNPIPPTNLPTNLSFCLGDSFVVNLQNIDRNSIIWNENPNDTSFYKSITSQGFYKYSIFNECFSVTDSFNVLTRDCNCTYYLPNSFTPNGDKLNDNWSPQGCDFVGLKVYIFNRWGEIMFELDENNPNWDGNYKGSPLPIGIYYYILQKNDSLSNITTSRGYIHLIR